MIKYELRPSAPFHWAQDWQRLRAGGSRICANLPRHERRQFCQDDFATLGAFAMVVLTSDFEICPFSALPETVK
jgi:hypothetical protein